MKDDEGKQSRASGLFERVWVSSIREEDSRAKRWLAVLERIDMKDSIREEDSRAKRRLAVLAYSKPKHYQKLPLIFLRQF